MNLYKNKKQKKKVTIYEFNYYKTEIEKLLTITYGEKITKNFFHDIHEAAAEQHMRAVAESLNIANSEIKNLSLEIEALQKDKHELSNLNAKLNKNIEELKNEINILEKQEIIQDMLKKIPSFTGSNNYEDEETAPLRYFEFQRSMTRILQLYKCCDTEKLCFLGSKLEDGAKDYFSTLKVSTYEHAINKFRENYFNSRRTKEILVNKLNNMKIGYNETFRMFGLKIMDLVNTIKFYNINCDDSFIFDCMVKILVSPLKSSVKIHPSVMEAIANADFLSLIRVIDQLIVVVPSLMLNNSHVEQILGELSSTKQVVVNLQRQDRKYGHICINITSFKDYVIIDELLFYRKNNGKLALCIPSSLIKKIKLKLKEIKIKSDIIKLCQNLIWPGMKTDLRFWFKKNFKFL